MFGGLPCKITPGNPQLVVLPSTVLQPVGVANVVGTKAYDNVLIVSPVVWVPATQGTYLIITLTSNAVFTLNVTTTGLVAGQVLVLTVKNTIGGAAGAMTLGVAFLASDTTPTMPADTTNRTWQWIYNGAKLVEIGPQATADVPN